MLVIKNSSANEEDVGLIPESGRFLEGGIDNPLQYSCQENPMEEEPGMLQSTGSQELDMT